MDNSDIQECSIFRRYQRKSRPEGAADGDPGVELTLGAEPPVVGTRMVRISFGAEDRAHNFPEYAHFDLFRNCTLLAAFFGYDAPRNRGELA